MISYLIILFSAGPNTALFLWLTITRAGVGSFSCVWSCERGDILGLFCNFLTIEISLLKQQLLIVDGELMRYIYFSIFVRKYYLNISLNIVQVPDCKYAHPSVGDRQLYLDAGTMPSWDPTKKIARHQLWQNATTFCLWRTTSDHQRPNFRSKTFQVWRNQFHISNNLFHAHEMDRSETCFKQ